MGGAGNTAVPQYAVLLALSMVTKLPKEAFNNMPHAKEEMRNLFLYAVRMPEHQALPARKMELRAFMQWYLDHYEECGSPLKDFKVETAIDWQFMYGFYTFVHSEGEKENSYSGVLHKTTGVIKPLPLNLTLMRADIPDTWHFEKNHLEFEAALVGSSGT
eukprot:4872691-Lingulodinium_polyedra.AAC.1